MNFAPAHPTRQLLLCALILGGAGQALRPEDVPMPEAVTREYLVENWQTDEGLPRNTISALAQDALGYLWLGTPHGLIRFDGARFVPFEADASRAMARGEVRQVYCDRAGVLWIATRRSGLFRYRDGTFESLAQEDLPAKASIDSIAEDGKGNLWLTRGDGMLGRLQSGVFDPVTALGEYASGPMLFKLTTDAAGGLWFYKQDTYGRLMEGRPTRCVTAADRVITLASSRDGGLWVSTGNALKRLPPGEADSDDPRVQLPFGAYGVSSLYTDRAGALWIGTAGRGLFRLEGNQLLKVAEVHHRIWDILEDAEGNLWVGTDGAGLFRLKQRVFTVMGASSGLSRDNVLSVCGDWVAPRGAGLGRILPTRQVEMVGAFEGQSITSVLEEGDGGVWLGTAAGRLTHLKADGKRVGPVAVGPRGTQLRVLHVDRKGNLWMGGFPSGLFFLPAGAERGWRNLGSEQFPQDAVSAIAEDSVGNLWIGTSSGELHRYSEGVFHRYGEAEGLPGFPIGALLATPDGGLWVGSEGGGLGRLGDGRFRFAGVEAGLHDNVITQLIEDDQARLWIGSSRGISRVRIAEVEALLNGAGTSVTCVHFGRSEGLANIQCTAGHQPSVWKTPSGQLRFATSRGVVSFDPASMPVNTRPPPLRLERVQVDGVAVRPRSGIKLPHDYRKLQFDYTALSFMAPDKVRFKRRMSGFDEGWVEDGSARTAAYPRLPPGRYEFQFTACNNDGLWNDEPFRLPFQILPAFWQTAWFQGLALLLFAAGVAGSARYISWLQMRRRLVRLERTQALDRERARIARDLHDDLGARLTQITFLTGFAAAEPEVSPEIRGQLQAVSQQARNAVQSLDETVWMVNPSKDSLRHLIAYLGSYAEQFFLKTPIRCRLDICSDAPDHPLPGDVRHQLFFLVKEGLNNALKHSGASEVWLRISVRGPVLRIVISDNGRGFLPAEVNGQRHGLVNMRRRAEAAGIRYRLSSAPSQGTRLTFRLRLTTGSEGPSAGISPEVRQ